MLHPRNRWITLVTDSLVPLMRYMCNCFVSNVLHRISHRSVQSVLSTRPGTLSISNTNLLADKLHMFRFPICFKWEMKNFFPLVLIFSPDWLNFENGHAFKYLHWSLSSSFWNFQTSAIYFFFSFHSEKWLLVWGSSQFDTRGFFS